ncbi:MAG TPA: multicopper oxidase domain-containing protein [Rhizomicrobium sp.]|jgi:FtsP/CotA-like multicopper oxidase with cupredoxin domain|nr:multicopper oxidase domain-containing protein [Rhizomicrobium sp.]
MTSILRGALVAFVLALIAPTAAMADTICPRATAGAEVPVPPELSSTNNVLEVSFDYLTTVDDLGRTLFCFKTPDGKESPTLRVHPGDTIVMHVTDKIPAPPLGAAEKMSNASTQCGAAVMTDASVNLHFHGLNISPKCHSDETIHTLINSGETFTYKLKIPDNEPPGLYWYHPHVHGIASSAVQGGASGLIVVEGIENVQPAVGGLAERLITIRDQQLGKPDVVTNRDAPFWDVSVNYVPVDYPDYNASVVRMKAGTSEFWRVANSTANTILDLKLLYDGVPQPIQIVGFDGVPTGSQNGTRQGTIVTQKDILLPTAGRVEFIVPAPPPTVKKAVLITETIKGGPASDSNPHRPLIRIRTVPTVSSNLHIIPKRNNAPTQQRFEDLAQVPVTAKRKLYFIEIPSIRKPPDMSLAHKPAITPAADPVTFYIAVEGKPLRAFDANEPPQIETTKGAVEEWVIQNRTAEVHEFHMHQIHFLVTAINGVPIPEDQQQWYDTHQVGFWRGKGPYPSITVKMDFRGAVVGDFLYHCHILDHEDGGMMAIIRVNPKPS